MQAEIHILERYYPESMGITLVINAPFVFWGCWQIIKPWIDPVAREKVRILFCVLIKKFFLFDDDDDDDDDGWMEVHGDDGDD
jgi:hypothetical protein